jgi:NAD(P)-dependent dehydrogenase (short-subunit alcohol dehydrogenase family)
VGGVRLPYVTSKGALIALARTLAVGHGRDGIAVTCVAPGLTGQTLCVDGGLVLR